MGKLNIAHHKSYHPYRRDNIEKVRKDEEEARMKEAQEEGRMMLADAEARIDMLRERSGVKLKKKAKDDDDMKALSEPSMKPAELPTTGGHINFFEDLELSAVISSKKKPEPVETDKGVPLAPSAKDLKPWYSQRDHDDEQEIDHKAEARRKRDTERKNKHDPLYSITKQLASSSQSSSPARRQRPSITHPFHPPEVSARLTRESSERERALALIQRKKREMAGSETPRGGESEYGDMYNRRAVVEAHRGRRHW